MKGGRGALVLSDSCLFIGRTVQLEQRNQAMNYFIGVMMEKMHERWSINQSPTTLMQWGCQ